MKILFTLDENGSDLLQKLLGFSDADFKIINLKSDIVSATDEIIELIGSTIYDTIAATFEAESATDLDKELLYRTQLAIAFNAYRTFAPDNDISHTNSGRKARVDDHEKPAFEWQIDRSNKSLERKYYKAVDAILNFLDKNVPAWKATDVYKESHRLFVRTTKDFDDYFDIGRSRLLLVKLLPGLRLAETSEIRPRLGNVLYDEMKAKLIAGELVDVDILSKIKEACVYKAIAWGMGRLSVQLFPEGVLQNKVSDRVTSQAKSPTLKSEPESVAQKMNSDASQALHELEQLVAKLTPVVYEPVKPHVPIFCADDKFFTT
jgi:hypothetical protein